ncbi:hypothetical protein SUGI_0584710 [Cryptomeria japonica]|nr:hypothetical protein SUGI_0584710 [Cryptomeria japonica]
MEMEKINGDRGRVLDILSGKPDDLKSIFNGHTATHEEALIRLTVRKDEGLFGGRFEEREYAMSVYDAHVEAVKNYVPAHKLLVFNVKEGWAPLCNFLGVPLPPAETPFPHSNERVQLLKRIMKNQIVQVQNSTDLWLDILSGKSKDLKSVLNGYTTTIDFPSVTVYHKLMEECPEAKIILTVREKEAWYESIKNTIYRAYKEPLKNGMPASVEALSRLVLWEDFLGGRLEDREYAMSVFEAHIEAVKNYVLLINYWYSM